MMKFLIVGGIHNLKNKGVESILFSLLEAIHEAFPTASVSILSMYARMRSQVGSAKVFEYFIASTQSPATFQRLRENVSFVQCLILASLQRLLGINASRLVEPKKRSAFKAYEEADYIVVCGTDVITDYYGFLSFAIFLSEVIIGIMFNKPIIFCATQIGPFTKGLKGKITTFLARLAISRALLITVRDYSSLENLKKMGIQHSSIRVVADPALLLESATHDRAKEILLAEGIDPEARPLVGINVSALARQRFQHIQRNLKAGNVNYEELMGQVVNYLTKKMNATVVLVPHVFGPKNDDDRSVAEEVCWNAGLNHKVKAITHEWTSQELKAIIGQLDLFISSRMHPLIHALAMRVPSVAIDYTFKSTDLMKAVGQASFVCHLETLSYNDLVSKIERAYSMKEEIRRELNNKVENIKKRSLLAIDLLKKYRMRS